MCDRGYNHVTCVWRSEDRLIAHVYTCMMERSYNYSTCGDQRAALTIACVYTCMMERGYTTPRVKIGRQLLLLYVYICVWWREVTTTSRVRRSEDSSVESVSSLHLYLDSRDRAQVQGKAFYQPSTSSSMRFHGCCPCILLYIHLSCNMFPIS